MAAVAAEARRSSGGGGGRSSAGAVAGEAAWRRGSGTDPRRSSKDLAPHTDGKRRSQAAAAALLELYAQDASKDPEESLRATQSLLVEAEGLFPESTVQSALPAKRAGKELEAIFEAAVRKRFASLRAPNQAKVSSGPALGLLRCIHTVVARGAQFRLQEQLQHLVLVYTGSAHAKDSAERLPPRMRSPRSAVHVQDRLKHWETLRREVDLVHYMHDLEVPEEIRVTGEDGGFASPRRRTSIQEPRKSSHPNDLLVARKTLSSPQSSSSRRRPPSRCLAELARKSRMLSGDLQVCDVEPTEAVDLLRKDKATQDLARLFTAPPGEDPGIDGLGDTVQSSSALGASSPSTASAKKGQAKPPPLTGITTGFLVAQSPECPKADRFVVQYPRRSSTPVAGLKQASSSSPNLVVNPTIEIPSRPSTGSSNQQRKRLGARPEDQNSNRVPDQELLELQAKMRRAASESLPPDSPQSVRLGAGFLLATMTPSSERRQSTAKPSSRRTSATPGTLSGGAPILFRGGGSHGPPNKAVSSKRSSLTTEERTPSNAQLERMASEATSESMPAPAQLERKPSKPQLETIPSKHALPQGAPQPGASAAAAEARLGAAEAATPEKSGTPKVAASGARHRRSSRLSSGSRTSHLGSKSSLAGLPANRGSHVSLESQMEDMLSKVLQQRGLEKKAARENVDILSEDQRAEQAAAARARRLGAGRLSQKLFMDAFSKSGADVRNSPLLEEAMIIPGKPKGVLEPPQNRLATVERSWTAEVGYLRGCMQGKVFPRLIKMFVDGNSAKLDLDSQFLVDVELDAVLRAVQAPHSSQGTATRGQSISELTLANNPSLTDVTMARFLSCALGSSCGRACIGPLKQLSLASCTGLGEVAMGTLADLLAEGTDLMYLEDLDFSNVLVPPATWPHLIAGLGCAGCLRRLHLAQTGCGRSSQANCVAIAELIENLTLPAIEVLDLGGNHFLDEGCRALGAALRHSPDSLRELDLSHNAGLNPTMFAKDEESCNPISHVLEALGETTLEKAAFVNCQLAHREDCVLEAAVICSQITHLDVSDNPHGETGLRSLVRLLAGEAPKLEKLCLEAVRLHPASGQMTYEFSDPSFSYRLHMENVQHRSILRLLLQRSEEVTGNSRCSCFRQGRFEDAPLGEEGGRNGMLQICSKREDRGWQVPDKGLLEFNFQMPSIYDEGEKIDSVYNQFQRRNKICLSFKGFAKLLQVYRGLVDTQSRKLFLEAMSKDLCLKFCQVNHLGMVTQDLLPVVLRTLLPETMGLPLRSALFELAACCSKNWPEALPLKLAAECRNLVFFNFVHPDGHYELSLESPADRATAQRCLVAAAWIKAYCQTKGLLDISEYGDLECMWHVVHNSHVVRGASTDWQLQERGKLVFDFVQPRIRFGKQGPAEEPKTMKALGKAIRESSCKYRDRLHALRLVAHQLVLTPDQLKEAIEWFPAWCPNHGTRKYTDMGQVPVRPRAEAYATLYNRTVEHSEVVSPKVLYNTSLLHEEEACQIRKRLGMMHTFDVVNLHDARSNLGTRHGPIDLVTWDGFSILKAMVGISKEETSENFQDGWWSEQADFDERGFAFILPASWHPDPPRVGQFTTTFTSQDSEVNYAHRRQVARRLLGWTFPAGLDE